jgi:ribonuclease P protein component
MENTFKKVERLHKKKLIKELFEKGSSFYLFPFKVMYKEAPSEVTNSQILISVPKRTFKKAVDRNKIKRRIREAYRLNKENLIIPDNRLIAYLYTAKESLPFEKIQSQMVASLIKLSNINLK